MSGGTVSAAAANGLAGDGGAVDGEAVDGVGRTRAVARRGAMRSARAAVWGWLWGGGGVLVAALGLALVAALPLGAQESDSTVTVEGEVLDGTSRIPVAVAIVALPALGRSAVTDELGYFRMTEVPPGLYEVRVMRPGYQDLGGVVPLNGLEVLAFHLTPGPIALDGIEVRVLGREDLDQRAMGISQRSIIGPLEMEEMRKRYFSLDQVLSSRYLPRARFRIGREPGDPGCLTVSHLSLRGRSCAAVVVDGMLMNPGASDWVYRMSTNDIFSVRFLYGAGAALRYGHRGGDGVLVIETRAGRR